MSAEMNPENVQDTPIEQSEPLKAVQTSANEDSKVSELMARIRKLDHNNTNLQKELEKRDKAGMSLEERMAVIEREREEATNRASTIEAFADSGLGEDWRRVFEESDPYKRADGVTQLLKQHEQDVAKKLATELGTAGAPELSGGKPQYSMEDLKGMSEAEINRAFKEGRVVGQK